MVILTLDVTRVTRRDARVGHAQWERTFRG